VVADDKKHDRAAAKVIKGAELIAVTLPSLCEFVWVLRRVYQFGQEDIVAALEALLNAENVAVNRPAADAR
jgi:predicted nucleic-acid-binding protein